MGGLEEGWVSAGTRYHSLFRCHRRLTEGDMPLWLFHELDAPAEGCNHTSGSRGKKGYQVIISQPLPDLVKRKSADIPGLHAEWVRRTGISMERP